MAYKRQKLGSHVDVDVTKFPWIGKDKYESDDVNQVLSIKEMKPYRKKVSVVKDIVDQCLVDNYILTNVSSKLDHSSFRTFIDLFIDTVVACLKRRMDFYANNMDTSELLRESKKLFHTRNLVQTEVNLLNRCLLQCGIHENRLFIKSPSVEILRVFLLIIILITGLENMNELYPMLLDTRLSDAIWMKIFTFITGGEGKRGYMIMSRISKQIRDLYASNGGTKMTSFRIIQSAVVSGDYNLLHYFKKEMLALKNLNRKFDLRNPFPSDACCYHKWYSWRQLMVQACRADNLKAIHVLCSLTINNPCFDKEKMKALFNPEPEFSHDCGYLAHLGLNCLAVERNWIIIRFFWKYNRGQLGTESYKHAIYHLKFGVLRALLKAEVLISLKGIREPKKRAKIERVRSRLLYEMYKSACEEEDEEDKEDMLKLFKEEQMLDFLSHERLVDIAYKEQEKKKRIRERKRKEEEKRHEEEMIKWERWKERELERQRKIEEENKEKKRTGDI